MLTLGGTTQRPRKNDHIKILFKHACTHHFTVWIHACIPYQNSQKTVRFCGREFESVILCEPGEHKYSPASCGRTGSIIQMDVVPFELVSKRSKLIRTVTDSPSITKTRPTVGDDAVQLTMSCPPDVTLLADSSNVCGV